MSSTQTIEFICYPFGMVMPGRSWTAASAEGYRFGFNGMEQDDETYGDGNEYDYGSRIYNSRLGRFLSMDPETRSFPRVSPFQFSENSPLKFTDFNGLGAEEKGLADSDPVTTTTIEKTDAGFNITKVITSNTTDPSTGIVSQNKTIKTLEKREDNLLRTTTVMEPIVLVGGGGVLSSGTVEVIAFEFRSLPVKVNEEISIQFTPNRSTLSYGTSFESQQDLVSQYDDILSDFPEIEIEVVGYTGWDWKGGENTAAEWNPETKTQKSAPETSKSRAEFVKTLFSEETQDRVSTYSYEEKGVENKNKVAADISIKLIE